MQPSPNGRSSRAPFARRSRTASSALLRSPPELEGGALERSPGAALALAIAPRAVWSYEEVLAPEEPAVTGQHIARVRVQARRLRRRLPFEGLPRASATLVRGCELVADDAAAAGVAALLLEAYVVMLESHAGYISQRN